MTADRISRSRRQFLVNSVAAVACIACDNRAAAGATPANAARSATIKIENFSASGASEGTAIVERVVKSDQEWRKLLTPESYVVTRQAGTERAFSGKYDKEKGSGLYRCICCGTALYDSATKYDSGTGWPSFWKTIASYNTVEGTGDRFGFRGAEITCARCDAHLGHVFADGPRPTGLRYCMNSVALNFVPRGA